MATPQQSLFGSMFQSPEQVEQARQQRLFEQARQSASLTPEQQMSFIGARSGQMTGGLLPGLAGYVDPELKKARDLQGIANEVKASLSPEEQKNPATVYAAMARRASELGYTKEAMTLAAEANKYQVQERDFGLRERAVGVQEEQNAISRARIEAEIEKEKRAAKLTDAQIREIDARIAALGDDKYTFQVIKGELGQPSQIVAINKKNPRDQQVITIGGAAGVGNPASGLPGNLTPAQINAELERRRKEGK